MVHGAGAGCAGQEDHLPHGAAGQGAVDCCGSLGHGQGNGFRGRGGRGGAAATAAATAATAATAAAGAAGVGRGGNGDCLIRRWVRPHRVSGDAVLLFPQLGFDFRQLVPDFLLVLFQLLRRFHRRVPQVQTGFFVDFVANGLVRGQLCQDKSVNIRHGKVLPDDVAFAAGAVLWIDGADGHFTGGDGFSLDRSGHRVRNAGLHGPLQNINPAGPLVDDLHPSAGPPHADSHGRGTDIQVLIALQGLVHFEKQTAGFYQNIQLFALLADADFGDGVHFREFDVVQVNPGVALFCGLQLVAAAQRHTLRLGHGPPAAVGDADSPLRFHQPHGRGYG